MPDGQTCQLLDYLCVLKGEGYENHAGAFAVFLSAKSKYILAKQRFILSYGGFYAKIGPHLKEIVAIGFTENVKNVGGNNAIHHFDMCGMSIFLQSHFSCNILSN